MSGHANNAMQVWLVWSIAPIMPLPMGLAMLIFLHHHTQPAMHVCVRENVWWGKLAFPHILPHAHSSSVSSLISCACMQEGECVEGHTCLSTCPPSCTHAICIISNQPCMCVWGRMCGKASVPLHTFSLMHTGMAGHVWWWKKIGVAKPIGNGMISAKEHTSQTCAALLAWC